MKELEFCEYWCGPLTDEQAAVLAHKVKTYTFTGAARAVGGIDRMPAYIGHPDKAWHVLDKYGYGQLASIDGRILFEKDWHITAYYLSRQESGQANRNATR